MEDETKRCTSLHQLHQFLATKTELSDECLVQLRPDLGKECLWEDSLQMVDSLVFLVKTLEQSKRYQDAIFQIEATLHNLSHLKHNIPPLTEENSLCLQDTLLDLQDRYNDLVNTLGDTTSPSVQNTSMEFLALSYCLACAVDQARKYPCSILQNYGVDVTYFFDAARKDRLFCCQDERLLKQRLELERFFTQKNNRIFSFGRTYNHHKDDFIEGKTPDAALYQDYIETDPEAKKQLIMIGKACKNHSSAIYGALSCFEDANQAYNANRLYHLHRLKASSLLACETSISGETNSVKVEYCFKINWAILGYANNRRHLFYIKHPFSFDGYKRDFSPQNELEGYIQNSQSSHELPQLMAENCLILQASPEDPPLAFPFYVGLADPAVQTTILLQAAENHIELLSDAKLRALLLHMFIKNVEKDNAMVSPFLLSLEDPLSIVKFERFVKLGIKVFVEAQPSTKPQLTEMLFVIRLYARALQTISSLHPDVPLPDATLDLIRDLEAFLDHSLKCVSTFPNPEEQKKEIRLAQVGLLLGRALETMSSETQARFLLEMIRVKNDFSARSSASDPTFVRECKKQFFYYAEKWRKVLGDRSTCRAFGNACIHYLLGGNGAIFEWHLSQNTIFAECEEKWVIDWTEPSIRNSQGPLTELHGELESTPSFKRLFKDLRYLLKIFGAGSNQQIYFESPVWGSIKISGHTVIQRSIDGKWFNYIPFEESYRKLLALNNALFSDHALWIDLSNPDNLRFCDLETGQQLCQSDAQGRIYHEKTKKVFYRIKEPRLIQLKRLEALGQINGWIDPSSLNQGLTEDVLELSRYRSAEDNSPLTFKWDALKKRWAYAANPLFQIATGPDIFLKLRIDHFLHLENEEQTKRTLLVPLAAVSSEGYSPSASINLTPSKMKIKKMVRNQWGVLSEQMEKTPLDHQKGAIRYFEYSITKNGDLIPHSLEGRIYLAHLYLAQKCYAEAAVLIKAIPISEQITQKTIEAVKKLFDSSEPCKDYSPNAYALHLITYYMIKRVDPFLTLPALIEEYRFVVDRINNVEHTLILSPEIELELIEFLQLDIKQ
jgi:hypothetical protein